jgi:hypothetical protein
VDIQGSRMAMLHEVVLSGNEPLRDFGKHGDDRNEGPPRPRIGDVLSIHLSQQANSQAIWEIFVWVQTAQGYYQLGPSFFTNPPSAGDPPARTIAFAACPGTIGWKVGARCPTDGEIAELTIQSNQYSGSGSFGVTPNLFVQPS